MSTNDQLKTKPLRKPNDPKFEAVIGFLALDFLALVSFGFGGAMGILVLRIIGVFIALLLFPYLRYRLNEFKLGPHPYIALVAFFFLGISNFWFSFYGGRIFEALLFNLISVAGFVGFFLIGGSIKALPKLKKEYIALALLGALALLVTVTTIYSLSRYGFFYAARFKGMVYYYDGVLFPIANEGKFLDGFLFRETSLSYAMAPSFLLACTGVGLFALRPKDGWRFFALLGFASIGLISLVLVPYVLGLILLVPVYLVFLIHYLVLRFLPGESKKEKRAKIAKVIFLALVALALLIVLAFVIDTFMGTNGFLKKIPLFYNNGTPRRIGQYIERIESALSSAMFVTSGGVRKLNFIGFLFGAPVSEISTTTISQNIFEFSVFYQNGFVGFLGLLFLIFFGIYHGWRYIEYDEDLVCRKMAIVSILLGFFIYFSFVNDEEPLLHAYHLDEIFSYHNSSLIPLTRSNYALMAAFLLGYIYTPRLKKAAEPALNNENIALGGNGHE